MVENALVWLTLLVAHVVEIFGIWRDAVARAHVGEILLDIPRGTTTAGSGQAYVIRHGDDVAKERKRECEFLVTVQRVGPWRWTNALHQAFRAVTMWTGMATGEVDSDA